MAKINVSTVSLCLWLSVVLRTVPVGEAVRILAVETIAGKSHWYFMSSVLKSLTDAGHTVTVFTPFPDGDRANYTEVDTSRDFPLKLDLDVMQTIHDYGDPFAFANIMPGIARFFCDTIYGNKQLTDLMAPEARDRYDLLLIEPVFIDCVSYLGDALGLPVVYSIPSPMITFAERMFTGQISNPACVSNVFASHAVPSTFVERLMNTALLTYTITKNWYDQLVTVFTNPRLYDLAPTVSPSIIFQNSHYVSESPRPITPNVVYVGGIHLKPPKTIPKFKKINSYGDRANYTEVDTLRYFQLELELDVMQTIREYRNPFLLANILPSIARSFCDAIYASKQLTDLMAPEARGRYDSVPSIVKVFSLTSSHSRVIKCL